MKYLITWNCGYGTEADVVECDSNEEAENEAYERWKEAAESYAVYEAEELTEENAEEYGFEDEL